MHDLQEKYHFNRTVNTISALPDEFPLHWHKYVEIIAMPLNAKIQKKPVLHIQQNEYEVQPGDLLFIWSGELHELHGNEEKRLIGLQFVPTCLTDLPEFAPYISLFRSIHLIRPEELPDLAERMMFHLQQIFSLQSGESAFCGVEAVICLLEMFMDLGKHLEKVVSRRTAQITAGMSKITEKMLLACDYIAENCEHDLSLDSVADYVGFSNCYFSRVFKQTTNYSFVEYVTLQRVKRAQALLADSNVSITEISYQAGFRSISTFNRVFRQYKGCSPSDYRKYYLV